MYLILLAVISALAYDATAPGKVATMIALVTLVVTVIAVFGDDKTHD